MKEPRRTPLAVLLALPWLFGGSVAVTWQVVSWMDAPTHDALVRARALADAADAFRLHVTSKGGVFSPQDGDTPGTTGLQTVLLAASKGGAEGQQRLGVQDAFLALQDLSRTLVSTGAVASLRAVSDNPLNPASRVSGAERISLNRMRDEGLSERWSVTGPLLYYTRALKADGSCMQCHGDPSAAPEAIRAAYVPPSVGSTTSQPPPSGFGYRPGDVVGMTSVTVDLPAIGLRHPSSLQLLVRVLGAMIVAAIGWLMTCALVCPALRRRVQYAERLAAGDPDGARPFAPGPESQAAREFAQLDRSLEVLHEGTYAAADLAKATARAPAA